MLKCGQKNNTKYTFGLRKEQMVEGDRKEITTALRYKCGSMCREGSKFCSSCGAKM